MSKVVIEDVSQLGKWMGEFVQRIDEQTVILLYGPVGVGKTQWTQLFVSALGDGSDVCSPSFALNNSYMLPDTFVEHFDLYRLETEEELESSGFWDVFSSEKGFVVIEWAERLNVNMLPPNWKKLAIHLELGASETQRTLVEESI